MEEKYINSKVEKKKMRKMKKISREKRRKRVRVSVPEKRKKRQLQLKGERFHIHWYLLRRIRKDILLGFLTFSRNWRSLCTSKRLCSRCCSTLNF